jgi:hypothetical protein
MANILMTPQQTDTVMSIRMCTTLVSLTLTFFSLLTMHVFKLNSGQHRLQATIFKWTFAECLINLMSVYTFRRELDHPGVCYAQGLFMQFAQVAIFCWTAVFVLNLYLVIVHRRLDVEKYSTWYLVVCCCVPTVCTLIPNITFAFGKTTVWCWISKEAVGGNAYRIGTFFVPFYVASISIIFLCVSIIYKLTSTLEYKRPDDRTHALRLLRRFYAYPVIFIVCYIPATVNRINNWTTGNDIYCLFIVHVLASPSIGTLNAIVFFCNIEVRNALGNIFVSRGYCSYCLGDVPLSDPMNQTESQEKHAHIEHSEDEILHDIVLS